MIALLIASVLVAPLSTPPPPYRRVSTVLLERSMTASVIQDTLCIGYSDRCEAYSLRTSKKLWSFKLPKKIGGADKILATGSEVFVCTDGDYQTGDASLLALDVKSGKKLWSLPRKHRSSAMAVSSDLLFVGLTGSHLSAIDRKTRKVKWTALLGKPHVSGDISDEVEAVIAADGRVIVNCNDTTFGLDASSGKTLWQDGQSYIFETQLVAGEGVVWIPFQEGAQARDLKTGKVLWTNPTVGYSEFGTFFGGNFVGIDSGAVTAVNPKTGVKIWSHPTGPENTSGGNQYGRVVNDLLFVCGIDKAGIYDSKGKALWSGNEDSAIQPPFWTDGKTLVGFDGTRITRYEHGKEAAIPTDSISRQALAAKLVASFAKLDGADTKRLIALGDDAFPSLLKAFLASCQAHDSVKKGQDSYPLYSLYHDMADVLTKVTTAKRSTELLAALKSTKGISSAQPTLMTLLTKFGKPDDVVPLFLASLEGFKTPGFEMYESNTYVARTYIINSPHPSAVKFMLGQLSNPNADYTLRQEGYWHLAGTGGKEGVEAVLKERHKRTLLRPLEERLELGEMQPKGSKKNSTSTLLAEKKDSKGVSWGLISSGILGSSGDLWIAHKQDKKWCQPRFLGISTFGPSRWTKPTPPEQKFAGKTAQQIVEGAWFALISIPELVRDSDQDGLTDLVEKRLGTDLKNRDTDGDGDSDQVDPWPNVAPRELTENEKIMEAVYEARYHFSESEIPGVYFATKGEKPFEMNGRTSPVMWIAANSAADWSTPLEQCYEQGVAFIRFHTASREERNAEASAIKFNSTKTEAKTVISTYYGGLNGTGYEATVRKLGDEWVVVEMHMSYIS